MPIVKDGNGYQYIDYVIPTEIDEKIPDEFYNIMAQELCLVFGNDILKPYDEYGENEEGDYYNLNTSTGGWYTALEKTCQRLDLKWLLTYYDSLEWYDSDVFDGIIESRIIEKQTDLNAIETDKSLIEKEEPI